MNLLIDTHIYLWFSGALEEKRLTSEIKSHIQNTHNTIYISIAAFWEMKIKQQKGLFKLSERAFEPELHFDFKVLPVELSHIRQLEKLDTDPTKPIHRDPFDRIMLAQALSEGLTFVTHDANCLLYSVPGLNLISA